MPLSTAGHLRSKLRERLSSLGHCRTRIRADVLAGSAFRRLWIARTVSMLGTQVTIIALPVAAVIQLHATTSEAALLSAMPMLPFLLFGLLAGVWVDLVSRRAAQVLSDLGRALCLAVVPIASISGWLSINLLFGVAFAVGSFTLFSQIAYQSYVPSLLAASDLPAGNSRIEASTTISSMAGSGLAGALVQLSTAPIAIAADAISYVISALLIRSIRLREPKFSSSSPQNPLANLGAGLGFLVDNSLLRPIVLTTAFANIFSAIRTALLVLFAVRVLHVRPAGIGLLFSVTSLAGVFGAVLATYLCRTLGVGRVLALTMPLAGIAAIALPAAQRTSGWWTIALLAAGQVLFGFVQPIYNICQLSLRQAVTPPGLQAQVHSSFTFIVWGAIPVGAALAGGLSSVLDLKATLLIAAAGLSLSGTPIMLSEVRGVRQIGQPAVRGD
jgi:hypothetical protein